MQAREQQRQLLKAEKEKRQLEKQAEQQACSALVIVVIQLSVNSYDSDCKSKLVWKRQKIYSEKRTGKGRKGSKNVNLPKYDLRIRG